MINVYELFGVGLDDSLKWKSHLNSVCAKASSSRLHFLTRKPCYHRENTRCRCKFRYV